MEMLPRIVQCSPGVSRLWITPGTRRRRGGKKRKGREGGEERKKKKSLDHGVKGLRAAYFMRLRRTY